MKRSNLIFGAIIVLLITIAIASCSNQDDYEQTKTFMEHKIKRDSISVPPGG